MAKTKCSLAIVGMSVKTNSPEAMQQALSTLDSLLGAAFPNVEAGPSKPKRKRAKAITPKLAEVKDVPPTSPTAAEGGERHV